MNEQILDFFSRFAVGTSSFTTFRSDDFVYITWAVFGMVTETDWVLNFGDKLQFVLLTIFTVVHFTDGFWEVAVNTV